MWIEARARRVEPFPVTRARMFEFLADVPGSGRHFPGVESITPLGDGRYRWRLAERSTLGVRFQGDYVAVYEDDGVGVLSWRTKSGNLRSSGRWTLVERAGAVEASIELATELELPIPKLIARPIQLFADREVGHGLDAQLAAFHRVLG
jgi:carbon monoxide dehydrogenase subunit G